MAESIRTPACKQRRWSHAPNNQLLTSGLSPEAVEDLASAFNDVWAMLYAQVPPEDDEAMEVSISLSRTLVALAAEGITDPKELRRKALENIDSHRPLGRGRLRSAPFSVSLCDHFEGGKRWQG